MGRKKRGVASLLLAGLVIFIVGPADEVLIALGLGYGFSYLGWLDFPTSLLIGAVVGVAIFILLEYFNYMDVTDAI